MRFFFHTSPSGESGAVLVVFAVFASMAVLILAFALDVGTWFEHERHLQLQADAAAHAAASSVAYPCTKKVKDGVYEQAGKYGGVNSVITPEGTTTLDEDAELYNKQVGGKHMGNVYQEINKKAFYNQPFENKPSESTTVEEAPCGPNAAMVDVKMTETNLPWFFKAANVPYINAHARISIVQQKFATAVLPIIQSEPVEARAFFVNDSTCLKGEKNGKKEYEACPDGSHGSAQSKKYEQEELASTELHNIGPNEERGTITWSTQIPGNAAGSTPAAVNIKVPHIGVRVAVAGKAGALKGAANETVSVCTHEYVECFNQDSGVVPPLLNISGYSAETKGTVATSSAGFKPVAHKVTLETPSGSTCTDGYFYVGNETSPTCTLTIRAELDCGISCEKGITVTPELVYTEGFSGNTQKVLGKTPFKLEGGAWTGTEILPSLYRANYGSTEVNLVVKCERKAGTPCEKSSNSTETKTLADVQRAFSAGPDGSNRVATANVFEPGAANPVPGEKNADAYEVCEAIDGQKCEHKLAVTVELKGSLKDATKFYAKDGKTPIAPFHILYADNDQDGDDQFVISCPPTKSSNGIVEPFRTALAQGCPGKYGVNTHSGSCTQEKEQIHECVGLVSVTKDGKHPGGELTIEELDRTFQNQLAKRIESPVNGLKASCPNQWKDNNEGGVPIIVANDSRLTQFFVVPFTVTDFQRRNEESPLVSIETFATFYVTGYATAPEPLGKSRNKELEKFPRDGCSKKLLHRLADQEQVELEQLPQDKREKRERELGFDDNTEQPREVLGHLIKYVNVLGEETGTTACKEDTIGTCEAVLTE
jgi:hypothetical protein